MAHVQKYSRGHLPNLLRHNERQIENSSNKDIDPALSLYNYSLLEPRSVSSYQYFLQRSSELYVFNRSDLKVAAEWIVTAPADLPMDQEVEFFTHVNSFLCDRYHTENALQSIVHVDEAGRAHLHFCFIPVVPDLKHGGEKICANELLNKFELQHFHQDLERYLEDHGLYCSILTGITRELGRSISVRDLKLASEYIRERQHQMEVEF